MMKPEDKHTLFASCAPGLEPFVLRELEALGLAHPSESHSYDGLHAEGAGTEESGGISFMGTLADVCRANMALRCAGRVLIRLGSFRAAAFSELRRKASRIPWERYLSIGRSIALRVTCRKSRLYHGDAVADRVAAAIGDRLGFILPRNKWMEAAAKEGLQLILIRLLQDECTISIDSSGEHLHRRGYRLATAKAPLRETLACAMLFASQWDQVSPFMDPFCGSGTLPIEAALLSRKIPPGLRRHFAFMDWPGFDPQTTSIVSAALVKEPAGPPPLIIASDRDKGAVRMARENAKRCGMSDIIHFSAHSVSAIQPPKTPGWVVTNPPFGIRMGHDETLGNLYAQLGKTLKGKCPGWQVTLLSSGLRLIRNVRFSFDSGIPVIHGGRRVRIFRAVV